MAFLLSEYAPQPLETEALKWKVVYSAGSIHQSYAYC
jgi:hypothetical protein